MNMAELRDNRLYILLFTFTACVAFAAILTFASLQTRERWQENKRLKNVRSLLEVFSLPEGVDPERAGASADDYIPRELWEAAPRETLLQADTEAGGATVVSLGEYRIEVAEEKSSERIPVYRAWRGEDALGWAFSIGGGGFWGPILGVLAVENDTATIKGITFVQDEETPGLGARINEDWFKNQFRGIVDGAPVTRKKIVDGEGRPAIRITAATGAPKGEYEVDAISGATETSTRMERFLGANILEFRTQMGESVPIAEESTVKHGNPMRAILGAVGLVLLLVLIGFGGSVMSAAMKKALGARVRDHG